MTPVRMGWASTLYRGIDIHRARVVECFFFLLGWGRAKFGVV